MKKKRVNPDFHRGPIVRAQIDKAERNRVVERPAWMADRSLLPKKPPGRA